jgi:hypothetical protein
MTICPHKDASWPKDFYVVDIVHGWDKINKRKRQRGFTVGKAFEAYFGKPFHRSTYYDQVTKWEESLTQEQRDSALVARRTHRGVWSSLWEKHKKGEARVEEESEESAQDEIDHDEGEDNQSKEGSLSYEEEGDDRSS